MWERRGSALPKERSRGRVDSLPADYFTPNDLEVFSSGSPTHSRRNSIPSSRNYSGSVHSQYSFSRERDSVFSLETQRLLISSWRKLKRWLDTTGGMKILRIVIFLMAAVLVLDQLGVFRSSHLHNIPLKDFSKSLAGINQIHELQNKYSEESGSNGTVNMSKLTPLGQDVLRLVRAELSPLEDKIIQLENNISAMSKKVGSRDKDIIALLSELKNSNAEVKSLKDRIYDASDVGASVLENLESYAKQTKRPWVFPCSWENCRSQNLSQVVNVLVRERASVLQQGVRVVQIGLCAIDVTQSLVNELNRKIKTFHVVEEWAVGSAASYTFCRQSRTNTNLNGSNLEEHEEHSANETLNVKIRDEEDMKAEAKAIVEWGKSFSPASVQIVASSPFNSKVVNSFESKSIDILFIDHISDSNGSQLLQLLKLWSAKVDTGGIIVGHSYGVPYPFRVRLGAQARWNHGSRISVSNQELAATKSSLDSFVLDQQENSVNYLSVAGDTSWYLRKRKVRLADLFNDP